MLCKGSIYYWFSGSQKLIILITLKIFLTTSARAQNCDLISPLPCDAIHVDLPYNLYFNDPVASTITDYNNQGTGFTMVQNYSGKRNVQDAAPPDTNVPGYLPSELKIADGKLQLTTSKGIGYLENNNQINAVGVKVDSRDKMLIKTDIINPYNGTDSQQAGIWFGIDDKTFVKLIVSKNRVELRREVNDISDKTEGTKNTDQRITGTINGLHNRIVNLKLVIDPAKKTASGFYSIDNGQTYLNVGAQYSVATISVQDMGITTGTAYTGLFASHRSADTPVIYYFDNFSVSKVLQFASSDYIFNVADNVSPGSTAGEITASATDSSNITYSIQSGNTNGAFSLDANNGQIFVSKRLNHHTQSLYNLTIIASTAEQLTDTASITIQVTAGADPVSDFTSINWSKSASQPYKVSEAQGEVVNGKLYSFGGFDSQKSTFTPTKRAYVFDPVTNKWTKIADLPHTPNGTNFGGITHAGIANDGTDIYFSGGYTSNTAGTGQIFGTQQVWKYNVATNNYTKLPDLPIKIAAGQLEYIGGKLHHIAGTNAARTQDLGNHYVLDLDNIAAGWKTLAPLPNPRQHAGAAVYEGKIYLIGGQKGQDEKLVTSKDVHSYDPQNNTWTKRADLPAPGKYGLGHISSTTVLMGNRIIVLGGEAVHQTLRTAMVSAFSPDANTWTSLTPLPATRYSGVAAVLNGNLYYTGGSKSEITYKGIPINGNALARENADSLNESSQFGIKKLTVFPNPVYDGPISITLENFEKNETVNISIVNMLGKVLQAISCITDEKGVANAVFNRQISLEKDTYFIKAIASSGTCSVKLLIP